MSFAVGLFSSWSGLNWVIRVGLGIFFTLTALLLDVNEVFVGEIYAKCVV